MLPTFMIFFELGNELRTLYLLGRHLYCRAVFPVFLWLRMVETGKERMRKTNIFAGHNFTAKFIKQQANILKFSKVLAILEN